MAIIADSFGLSSLNGSTAPKSVSASCHKHQQNCRSIKAPSICLLSILLTSKRQTKSRKSTTKIITIMRM